MADIVKKVAYFAMDVPDKPGEGTRVLGALAEAGVNLLAFTGFPSGRKSQLDIIPEDVVMFKKAAKAAKIETRPQKFGILIQGDDRKGVVAGLLKTMAEKKINVTAIDAVSAGAGRYAAILWVESGDVNKAVKALGESLMPKVIEEGQKIRCYVGDIEKATLNNSYFRQVLFTGKNSQLVVMCLQPGEEIGNEAHSNVDQFFRIEEGNAKFVFNGQEEHIVGDGSAVVVTAGTFHNVINTSSDGPLKLYTIYSPPNHPDGTIHKTKAEADAAEAAEHH